MKNISNYKILKQLFLLASIIPILVFLSHCTSSTNDIHNIHNENLSEIKIDINKRLHKKVHYISDVVDTFFIIPLQTDTNSFFAEISKLLIYSDTIFILDSKLKTILLFDIRGKYINRIEKIGKGRGEYFRIHDFTVDYHKNRIIIYDDVLSKHLFFTFKGQYLKEKKVHRYFSNIAYLRNGLILKFNNYQHTKNEDRYICWITNMKDSVILKEFPYEKKYNKRTGFAKKCITQFNEKVYFSPIYDNKVYCIDDSIKSLYKIDFGNYNPDFEHIINPKNVFKPNRVSSYQDFYENDIILYFNYAFVNTEMQIELTSVVFNKKNNEIIFPWDNVIIDIPFLALGTRTIASYNNYFVTSSYPSDVINYMIGITNGSISIGPTVEKWEKQLIKYKEQVSILNKLQKTDNPILFMYKFKANETNLD